MKTKKFLKIALLVVIAAIIERILDGQLHIGCA